MGLAKEYVGTCGEYAQFLKTPFKPIGIKDLFKCSQSDWKEAFRQWGVLQFFFSILVNLVMLIVAAISGYSIGSIIPSFVYQIAIGYVLAHLTWFGIIKKDGCCCICCVCISDAPILLAMYGGLCIVWGALTILSSLAYISAFDLGFIITICFALYSVTLCYMGVASIRLWQQLGSKKPTTAETVVGKAAEVVGGAPGTTNV